MIFIIKLDNNQWEFEITDRSVVIFYLFLKCRTFILDYFELENKIGTIR